MKLYIKCFAIFFYFLIGNLAVNTPTISEFFIEPTTLVYFTRSFKLVYWLHLKQERILTFSFHSSFFKIVPHPLKLSTSRSSKYKRNMPLKKKRGNINFVFTSMSLSSSNSIVKEKDVYYRTKNYFSAYIISRVNILFIFSNLKKSKICSSHLPSRV